MKTYHKIQTVYKRDMEAKGRSKPLIIGKYSRPEFELLENVMWSGTEKIDGTNIRVMLTQDFNKPHPDELTLEIRGKKDISEIPKLLMKRLDEIFTLDKMKQIFKFDVCLYGEGFGGRIQKAGPLYGELDFILFDVKIGHWWLKRDDVNNIAKQLGIKSVPVVYKGTLKGAVEYVKKGFKSVISDKEQIAEGLILEPDVQLFDRKMQRIITKIKYKDFK